MTRNNIQQTNNSDFINERRQWTIEGISVLSWQTHGLTGLKHGDGAQQTGGTCQVNLFQLSSRKHVVLGQELWGHACLCCGKGLDKLPGTGLHRWMINQTSFPALSRSKYCPYPGSLMWVDSSLFHVEVSSETKSGNNAEELLKKCKIKPATFWTSKVKSLRANDCGDGGCGCIYVQVGSQTCHYRSSALKV